VSRDGAIIDLLRARDAGVVPHAGGRSLLEHLVGTAELLGRWDQPDAIRRAALIHSVYGTEVYPHAIAGDGDRAELAAVAGGDAERLAYLFAVTPRRLLFAGTARWMNGLPGDPSRDELDAIVIMHMANVAEQSQQSDGTPGRWLVRVRDLAAHIFDSETIRLPAFVGHLLALTAAGEADIRARYLEALIADSEARTTALALVAAACPVLAEPCVALAEAAAARGDGDGARAWGDQARTRLLALGTAWDKRQSYEQWLARAEQPSTAITATATSAHRLARGRFHRYVESLRGAPAGAVYPDIDSTPFHDPGQFEIVADLEANYEVIREEALALDCGRFQRESEQIDRTGSWDVAFLHERGRRNKEVCDACPVTASTIERHRTIRTHAGLSYFSRMRGDAHIAAHRGPTNLRLRCHLGILVPEGDCGIRVGDELGRWEQGRCIVFDDRYDHEAWNHTAAERIVLIVDLWHPGISADEVRWLESVQAYAAFHAVRLGRYWARNDAAARLAAGGLG
jgi:aspartate beta-hydroxylase